MQDDPLRTQEEQVRNDEVSSSAEGGRALSRRNFVAVSAAAGVGWVLTSCGGSDDAPKKGPGKALKAGLAAGMLGGPTGFPGAERYQYPEDSPEGRAILALRRLKRDGKAPSEIVVQQFPGTIAQWTKPWPEGGPSLNQVFEEETGIKIKLVPTDPTQEFANNLRAATLKDDSFHVVQLGISDVGELVEAGLLADLDEFVDKYKPDYAEDPKSYIGGEARVAMFNKYAGRYHGVTFDGDWQVWYYNSKLFEDSKFKTEFEDRYGRPLEVPKTWEDYSDVAAFFTRRDDNLLGDTSLKNPFWGLTSYLLRYVSLAAPNQYYFDEDGTALIGSDAGIQALEEHRKAMEYSFPDATAKSFPEQFGSFGDGSAAMGLSWINLTKFVTPGSEGDKGGAKYIRSTVPPGREIDGTLIQRSVLGETHVTRGVNRFIDKNAQEAAYLLLQWAGGSHVYTWYTSNTGGFDDPHHTYSVDDPLVRKTYDPTTMDTLKEVAPVTVPQAGAGLNGGHSYQDALDRELQQALTGQKSEAQAMQDAAAAWEKITDRLGRDKQAEAICANREAWPS